ncbi:MAG: hypothetical protein KTR28_05290 [Micavibrio sp.]|nr:hypothetical protein [Micavibrio sp.]
MNATLDTHVLELLTSKICHDLISPIGAVNNGIEFMVEMGGGDEATDLIAYSAKSASSKLQAFRMAYGAGGADGSIKPEDVHKAVEAMIEADGKVKQVWDPYADFGYGFERPEGFAKALICAFLLALDSLPKGGELDIEGVQGGLKVVATGQNAVFKELVPQALMGDVETSQLSPKIIHAYVSGLLLRQYGFIITAGDPADNAITILLHYPVQ